jgi:hypothetical protein
MIAGAVFVLANAVLCLAFYVVFMCAAGEHPFRRD